MDANQLVDEGISLSASGHFEEAIERLKSAAQLDPNSSGIYVHLGRAYFRLHQMDEALSAFQAAVRINPRSASARKWLGVTLLASERPRDAVIELQMAVGLDPEIASTYLGLYAAYRAIGRPNEAQQSLRKAKHLNPEIDKDMDQLACEIGSATQDARRAAAFWWNVAANSGWDQAVDTWWF